MFRFYLKLSRSNSLLFTGDLLIIMAQIIVSVQMVYEERFVSKFNVPPLAAVGWEGKSYLNLF